LFTLKEIIVLFEFKKSGKVAAAATTTTAAAAEAEAAAEVISYMDRNVRVCIDGLA